MTTIEKAALDAALSDALRGGETACRELRLSAEEAEYLCGAARLTPMGQPGGEKRWYEVRPKGAMKHE